MSLAETLAAERRDIEAALDRLLPGEEIWPQRLHRAMRYAVLGGGKRIRPILARQVFRTVAGDPSPVTEACCALELIHCYSLVHDDLPALDDDVLRRGRATVHLAFDEALAILVGDALLTHGLLVLASHPPGDDWASRRATATAAVAEAISSRGMVGGQAEDLEASGTTPAAAPGGDDAERLDRIHRHKTGCLLQASVELGAILGGASDTDRSRFGHFGGRLGLAFQVADDILDATASAAQLGKSPGKDAAAGKLTYVALYGLDEAHRRLAELEAELVSLAVEVEGPGGMLAELARLVARRQK